MKRAVGTVFFFLAVAQFSWGQTNGVPTPTTPENAAWDPGTLAVIGATAEQEASLRSHIQTMHPQVLPLRVLFVAHWKYLEPLGHFSFMCRQVSAA
jgi:hypothetical protein